MTDGAGLTVADLLALPVVRQGGPLVLTGAALDRRPLRWVHATELADIAPLLRAGDLILTTGVGLPADDDEAALDGFVRSLADAECAGLMVEYGRRWRTGLPQALITACRTHDLPLLALTHEVRFAAVIQTVGELVVARQLAELRDAERVHETFTELSFAEAGHTDVLEAVRRLSGAPVVLEDQHHRPVDYLPGPTDDEHFLDNWQARSARVRCAGRTGWDRANGWLVTELGTRERRWGRLIIVSPDPAPQRLVAVAERAAASLALHRFHDRDRDRLTRRRHHELMIALIGGRVTDEVFRRCELAGLPSRGRQFVGLVLRPRAVGVNRNDLDEVIAAVVAATHALRTPALVCEIEREVRVLLSMTRTVDSEQTTERIVTRVGHSHAVVAAAGRTVPSREEISQTLIEARQVADALPGGVRAPGPGPGTTPAVHRLEDVHLRGLLALMAKDERLQLFTRRELKPLYAYDASAPAPHLELLPALRALLTHPTSKSDAAAAVHLSRPAFYDRLTKIEAVLGASLDDPDIRVSLHVALLTDDLNRRHQD